MGVNVATFTGVVYESLPGAMFKIKLENGHEVLGHLAGKLRIHHIKILPGDRVTIEIGEYDNTRGRIIRRL